MTAQPLPHNRIREFTAEATALAKLLGNYHGDFANPDPAMVRAIAEGLVAAYNTGREDATQVL